MQTTASGEFYLDEEGYPDARDRLDEDVKKFNRKVSASRRIGSVKVRDIPFEKTTTMKIKRHKIGQ